MCMGLLSTSEAAAVLCYGCARSGGGRCGGVAVAVVLDALSPFSCAVYFFNSSYSYVSSHGCKGGQVDEGGAVP